MLGQRFHIFFISWIIHNFPLIVCINATKESTIEKPLAVSISRLPTSAFQKFAINSTNLDEDSTNIKSFPIAVKEVREPPEYDEPVKNKQNKSISFEPSSTPTNQNYVTIGHVLKSKFHNYSNNFETGFTPFIPSPQYTHNIVSTSYPPVEEDLGTGFKTSAIVKHEHFYPPGFNNHPTFGDVQYEYNVELPYSKIHDLSHITTFAPPKVNPMQRPNLYYKSKKKYPFLANHVEDYGKANEFHFHHEKHPPEFYNINGHLDNSPIDDNFFHNYKPGFHDKHFHKNGLWQILTTLLPIGLLLTALPPKVIFINSTNTQPPLVSRPPFFRNNDGNPLDIIDSQIILKNLASNLGITPSNDLNCNKQHICKAALKGSSEKTSFTNYSLWYLISRSSDSIRKKLYLEDIFQALKRQQCEQFSCFEENVIQKNQTQRSTI